MIVAATLLFVCAIIGGIAAVIITGMANMAIDPEDMKQQTLDKWPDDDGENYLG